MLLFSFSFLRLFCLLLSHIFYSIYCYKLLWQHKCINLKCTTWRLNWGYHSKPLTSSSRTVIGRKEKLFTGPLLNIYPKNLRLILTCVCMECYSMYSWVSDFFHAVVDVWDICIQHVSYAVVPNNFHAFICLLFISAKCCFQWLAIIKPWTSFYIQVYGNINIFIFGNMSRCEDSKSQVMNTVSLR